MQMWEYLQLLLCAFAGINETNPVPSRSHSASPEASGLLRFEPVLSSRLTGGAGVSGSSLGVLGLLGVHSSGAPTR